MNVSTKEEVKKAERICQIKDQRRFIKLAEKMMQEIARRQEKLLQIQKEKNLTIEIN